MDINACKPKNATIAKLIALEAMIVLVNLKNESTDDTIPPWIDIVNAIKEAGSDAQLCASYVRQSALSLPVLKTSLNGGDDGEMPRVHALFARFIETRTLAKGDVLWQKNQEPIRCRLFIKAASACSVSLLRVLAPRLHTAIGLRTLHSALCEVAQHSVNSAKWLANENALSALTELEITQDKLPVIMRDKRSKEVKTSALTYALRARNYLVLARLLKLSCSDATSTTYTWRSSVGACYVCTRSDVFWLYIDALCANDVRAMHTIAQNAPNFHNLVRSNMNVRERTIMEDRCVSDTKIPVLPSTQLVHYTDIAALDTGTTLSLRVVESYIRNVDARDDDDVENTNEHEILAIGQLLAHYFERDARADRVRFCVVLLLTMSNTVMRDRFLKELDKYGNKTIEHELRSPTNLFSYLSGSFEGRVGIPDSDQRARALLLYLVQHSASTFDASSASSYPTGEWVQPGIVFTLLEDLPSIPISTSVYTSIIDYILNVQLSFSVQWTRLALIAIIGRAHDREAFIQYIHERAELSPHSCNALALLIDCNITPKDTFVKKAITSHFTHNRGNYNCGVVRKLRDVGIILRAQHIVDWTSTFDSATIDYIREGSVRAMTELLQYVLVNEKTTSRPSDEQCECIIIALRSYNIKQYDDFTLSLEQQCQWPIFNPHTSLLSLIKTEDQSLAIKLIDTIEQRILKITTTKKRPRDDDDNNDNNDVLY